MSIWVAEVDEQDDRPQRWVVYETDPGDFAVRFDSLSQAALTLIGAECGDPDEVGMAVWQRRIMERMKGRFLPSSAVIE